MPAASGGCSLRCCHSTAPAVTCATTLRCLSPLPASLSAPLPLLHATMPPSAPTNAEALEGPTLWARLRTSSQVLSARSGGGRWRRRMKSDSSEMALRAADRESSAAAAAVAARSLPALLRAPLAL